MMKPCWAFILLTLKVQVTPAMEAKAQETTTRLSS
jgi:hypothetical protein